MGYIGTCRGIGYGFEVLDPEIGYLLLPFFVVFLVRSLDNVAKLYYLILERENATL